MVLRMLRVALPVVPERQRGRRPGDRAAAGRRRLSGLPPRGPGARARQARRALPALRAQLPRLGRGGGRRASTRRCAPPTRSRAAPSRSCASAACRADLEFRRSAEADADLRVTCQEVQRELGLVDADIAQRYFGGARAARPCDSAMHFAIRFRTEYVYDAPVTDNLNALRVRPATTSSQRCDEFTVRIEPEARVGRHSRLLRHRGARVRHRAPAQAADDRRARARRDGRAARAAGRRRGRRSTPRPTPRRRASTCCRRSTSRTRETLDELVRRGARGRRRWRRCAGLCDLIPDRYEYRTGATYVGSTVEEFLEAGAGVCQDYVHLALILLRRNGIAARYVSGYLWAAPADEGDDSVEVETHAWLEALLPGRERPRRAGLGRRRPDEPPARGRAPREDRPRPPLRRRAAGARRLPGRRDLEARRERPR